MGVSFAEHTPPGLAPADEIAEGRVRGGVVDAARVGDRDRFAAVGRNGPGEDVVGDSLDAGVRPVGARPVRPWQRVPRRIGKPLGPEDRRGIENDIALRAGVDRGGPLLRLLSADECRPRPDNLEAGDVGRRVAVILPADEAGDPVPRFHPGAGKNPVVGLRADPVAAAVDRLDVAGPHQIALVGALFRERPVHPGALEGRGRVAAVRAAAEHDPVVAAIMAGAQRRHPADGVAGEKQEAHSRVSHLHDRIKLPPVPVFIVADAEEGFALEPPVRGEQVAVGGVADVVAVLLEEVGQRVFKRQELTGPDREWIVDDARVLRVPAVGAVEADVVPRATGALGIGVNREVARPRVVGVPGVVGALEEDVGRAVVGDDERNVALPGGRRVVGGDHRKPAEVDAADPVGGDDEARRSLPAALVEIFFAGLGVGLRHTVKGAKRRHQSGAAAAVVAQPKDLEPEPGWGISRDEKLDPLASPDALPRAIAFDAAGADVIPQAHLRELPIE